MKHIFIFLLFPLLLQSQQVILSVPDVAITPGQTVEVVATVSGYTNIASGQFGLNFDTAFLGSPYVVTTNAVPGFGAGSFSFPGIGYANAPNDIRCFYSRPTGTTLADGTWLFTLYFVGKQSGNLSERLVLRSTSPVPRAYTPPLVDVGLGWVYTAPGITLAATDVADAVTLAAWPNPGTDSQTVSLTAPAGDVSLTVVDAQGYVHFGKWIQHTGGSVQYPLDLAEPGMYFVIATTQRRVCVLELVRL